MLNVASHMRISGVAVTDSDVDSRLGAAKSLASTWRKDTNCATIVSKVAQVAAALYQDMPSEDLGLEVQLAIQKKSPSYLYDERPLDVSVCAGMAMVSILDSSTIGSSGWIITDVYAAALWSALAYQPVQECPRREKLRSEVLMKASDWSMESAEKSRERIEVPDPKTVTITVSEDNEMTSDFNVAMSQTIESLRRNAALDREELDFLWWVQLGRSRLLKKQLSEIAEATRVIALGLEAAKLLRRLPCEIHREIVLRTLNENMELSLGELLEVLGDDREPLCVGIVKSNVINYPDVFPLLYALQTGEVDGIGASVKRPISEWGERALLEATLARLMSQGAGRV